MARFNARSEEVTLGGSELSIDIEETQNIFSNLPIDAVLKIFKFLDSRSLCRCSEVQRSWYNLSNMDIVWDTILERDKRIWKSVGHRTHFKVSSEDTVSKKEMYMRCRPEVALKKVASSVLSGFIKKTANRVRSFTPKCILFGSGLESTQLVRNWIFDTSPGCAFKQVGYTQGVSGIGAGILLELVGYGTINVVTLFNATWAERKAIVAGERPRINRLLEDPNKGAYNADIGDEMSYEDSVKLLPQIRSLCQTMDVAMFSVDCNESSEQIRVNRSEMRAMLSCAPPKTPLLVLNCQSSPSVPIGATSLEVAELLELENLDRPWLVHAVCTTDPAGMVPGVKWCMQELEMI